MTKIKVFKKKLNKGLTKLTLKRAQVLPLRLKLEKKYILNHFLDVVRVYLRSNQYDSEQETTFTLQEMRRNYLAHKLYKIVFNRTY